jgi:predicted RNase H-like HicB family nuclease
MLRGKVAGWRMTKYEVIIYWSEEDEAYIGEVPQLAGCLAHGASQEEALRNVQDAIGLWIETAQEYGDPVPEPKGRRFILA